MSDILRLPRQDARSALYLVTHGPYREPRFIELQYFRILRYQRALEEQVNRRFEGNTVFVDLNYPRFQVYDSIDRGLPNLRQLLDQVESKAYGVVFLYLRTSEDFQPSRYAFVPDLLRKAGAEVFNAYYDDGDVIAVLHHGRRGDTRERGPDPQTAEQKARLALVLKFQHQRKTAPGSVPGVRLFMGQVGSVLVQFARRKGGSGPVSIPGNHCQVVVLRGNYYKEGSGRGDNGSPPRLQVEQVLPKES
jgi:hypothetical protein